MSLFLRLTTPTAVLVERAALSSTCLRSFSKSSTSDAQSLVERRRIKDPYALAQARQRKTANLARRAILKKQRDSALGDPVRSKPTTFITSLKAVPTESTDMLDLSTSTSSPSYLNYSLDTSILKSAISASKSLTAPYRPSDRSTADPGREAVGIDLHEKLHQNALSAISRIIALDNGNRSDLTRLNIQRCISTFGRHVTDASLAPKPPSNIRRGEAKSPPPEKTPRAGPDTGSPEVQIASLTTKIRGLVDHLDGDGRKDKVNKRNLQVLVHKRQKLLQYLRRKERGGERWTNIIHALGLQDASWKGEISLQ